MATFKLLPDGTTGTNEWQAPAHGISTCAASNIDTNNGDTDYCGESTHSHEVTFTMANPSLSSADIDSITSVQIIMSAAYTLSSGIATRIISLKYYSY